MAILSPLKRYIGRLGILLRGALRRLASLRLAVILMVVLAAVLAWATVLEAATDREHAQWYVYGSSWFVALLALLAANILAAALVRFPWKRSQAGFLLAHLGLLVLLAGSIQTLLGAVQGQLSFAEGETEDSLLTLDRSQIRVIARGPDGWIPTVFSFDPGPGDWPVARTLDFGLEDGVGLRVLRFFRHARREASDAAGAGADSPAAGPQIAFGPVEIAGDQAAGPEAAVLVAVTAGGATQQVWLQRNDPRDGLRKLDTPGGPVGVEFGYERAPLGFSVKLLDFQRGLNPGRMGDASFASSVQLVDEARGIDRECEVSMNHPLVHGKYTFYQSGCDQLGDGREVSRLSVAYDPGRFLKYLGSLMVCAGTFIMFYLRAGRGKGRSPLPWRRVGQVPVGHVSNVPAARRHVGNAPHENVAQHSP